MRNTRSTSYRPNGTIAALLDNQGEIERGEGANLICSLFSFLRGSHVGKQTRDYNDGWLAGVRAGKDSISVPTVTPAGDLAAFAVDELSGILNEKVGYVRLGAGKDGLFWLRYKWTQGPLAGWYTLTSAHLLEDAISALCVRVRQCEVGECKATFDHPYRSVKDHPKG